MTYLENEPTLTQLALHRRVKEGRQRIFERRLVKTLPVKAVSVAPKPVEPVAETPEKPDPIKLWVERANTIHRPLPPARTTLVLRIVGNKYGFSPAQIKGQSRIAPLCFARQVAFWILRQGNRYSLPEIGRRIGYRDHTSVLHGVRKIDRLMAADPGLAAEIHALASEAQAIVEADARERFAAICNAGPQANG